DRERRVDAVHRVELDGTAGLRDVLDVLHAAADRADALRVAGRDAELERVGRRGDVVVEARADLESVTVVGVCDLSGEQGREREREQSHGLHGEFPFLVTDSSATCEPTRLRALSSG